jgi:cell division protein FtsW
MKTVVMLLLLAVGGLVALSLAVLTSASLTEASPGLSVSSQAAACGIGMLALMGAASMDHGRWQRGSWALFGVTVALLALVLVFGPKINGARRWLYGVQPAELAKLALIVSLAAYGASHAADMGKVFVVIRGVAFLAAPLTGLVLVEPDRGTAALMLALTVAILLVAGARWRVMTWPVVVGVAALVPMIAFNPMARGRIEAWMHPEQNPKEYHQVRRGLLAFGSGGVEGTGVGKGTMKLSVPEYRTDFILPAVGEELGLTFTLGVVGAYLVILWAGATIALRAPDRFGQLMASGITFLIAMQAMINIGVVTAVLPNKGMPLPFVSRGGSNLVVLLTAVGILASIARAAGSGDAEDEGEDEPRAGSRVGGRRAGNPFKPGGDWVGAS